MNLRIYPHRRTSAADRSSLVSVEFCDACSRIYTIVHVSLLIPGVESRGAFMDIPSNEECAFQVWAVPSESSEPWLSEELECVYTQL